MHKIIYARGERGEQTMMKFAICKIKCNFCKTFHQKREEGGRKIIYARGGRGGGAENHDEMHTRGEVHKSDAILANI
jgi:hypothetical protein